MRGILWNKRALMATAVLVAIVVAVAVIQTYIQTYRSDGDSTSVKAAMDKTCNQEVTRYVDVSIALTSPDSRDNSWSFRINGANYHGTNDNGSGEEEIGLNGRRYYRPSSASEWMESSSPQQVMSFCGPTQTSAANSSRSTESTLYEAFPFSYEGSVTLNGESVKHYSTIPDPTRSALQETDAITFTRTRVQLWVNDSSRIVQAMLDYRITSPNPNDSSTGVVKYTLSDYGEVNTITAPVLPMPTPTPTLVALRPYQERKDGSSGI